jgi:hypothetical protein
MTFLSLKPGQERLPLVRVDAERAHPCLTPAYV